MSRTRSEADERNLIVSLTEEGYALRSQAVEIPAKMHSKSNLTIEEKELLYRILYKVMEHAKEQNK